jgi:tetratricopeptide (TPR) repeat protein
MKAWSGLPALGAVALIACAPVKQTADELVLLDESVQLARTAEHDSAVRELNVDDDAVIVAYVDENLTDVHVKISAQDSVEVENHLGGAGIEIATLAVPQDTRVKITLEGPQNAVQPGSVHLRVTRFRRSTDDDASFSTKLDGFAAWSAGTRASFRSEEFKAVGRDALDRAIASFTAAGGDEKLATQAQIVKANALRFFQLDMRASRATAQAAAQALGNDALDRARAQQQEADALAVIATETASEDPKPDEAAKLAREMLTTLGSPASALSPIERARAITSLGAVELQAGMPDDADKHFAAAQAIYHEAGYVAGEREVRGHMALALLERGRFRDAAAVFEELLPDLAQFPDPDMRAAMYLGAARGQSFSGRTDRAVELLLEALDLARDYHLPVKEAGALQGLGHAYQNRGDLLQARAFFTEALRITREQNDVMEYTWGLASAGVVAREDGDYAKAIELHEEAVKVAANPIAKVRTLRELGLDYYAQQNYPKAIEQYRRALAVKLPDPRHHAYSDVKRNLAQALTDNDDGSGASFKEVARLVDETLESSLKVGDWLGVIGAHRVKANLLAAQGRPAEALKEFETTFALAKESRDKSSSTEARGATLTHEQYALRGYLDVALKDVPTGAPRAATPREEQALYTLERARDTYFGPARMGELDAATSARVEALLGQMAEKSLKIAALLRSPGSTDATALAALQSEMSNLHAELDRVRTEAASKRVSAAAKTPVPAPALRSPAPGVAQVSYALGNRRSYAWARTGQGILVTALAKSPKDLEAELTQLGALDRQASPHAVETALKTVSADLLPRGLLAPESSAIEIVAEGRIASVPFAGLYSAEMPGRRLVETHAITMITSLYAPENRPRLNQARPFRLVALASGTTGLRSAAAPDPVPKLRAATSEIQTVAGLFSARDPAARIKLLVPPDGSASELHGLWGSGADVVHFATHALADLRQPLASLLVLPATGKGGAPTYLTAGQVESWRGDAELVFLSACDSAVGPPRYAQGMPGLQRAFLRAGARGVIATLWPIEDVQAQEFSADFYRRYTSGVSAAQALGDTQRAWLAPRADMPEAEQARRHLTALAHGFYTD